MREELRDVSSACRPFLGELRGTADGLFRGFGMKYSDPVILLNVFKNRRPQKMGLFFHDVADRWFFERFGVRYRSNVVMCFGNPITAAAYGNLYLIVPCGDFSICWSSQVEDLFVHSSMCFDGNPDSERDIRAYLERLGYCCGDVAGAIHSGNELLVHCDRFYGIRVSSALEAKTVVAELLEELPHALDTREHLRTFPAR